MDEDWETFVLSNPEIITYQLVIQLKNPVSIVVGKLGCFDFPAGRYIYTGSARRNMVSRIRRHLLKNKTLRWHIDYLLATKGSGVEMINFSAQPECRLNQQSNGSHVVPGFGASDCRAQCGSHLVYLGETD